MQPIPATLHNFASYISCEISKGKELFEVKSFVNSFDFSAINFSELAEYDPAVYKRKLLYSDDFIDIFLIGWAQKQGSKIHDHPENGCLMRVLNNELCEETYVKNQEKLEKLSFKRLVQGETGHIKKCTVLHRIFNESEEKSLSLHVYSPPNYKTKYYDDTGKLLE